MHQDPQNLIWIDLEMTGLDPENDKIIEIATVITNGSLDIIAEGSVIAIHQTDDTLAGMDEWNTTQHGKSGLTERVKNSHVSTETAEQTTLDFLALHVPANTSPICGNSICQDRRFLARYMPRLENYFHYRNLDVSTLKELARRWAPKVAEGVIKQGKHLALEDIRDSIKELRHYREVFLRLPES
ncbi:MAG: oligoribonuclease [Gammaproteobacteria bacterium]|nr:oligoribonuclease [Gammaproteobacteria bacterium]